MRLKLREGISDDYYMFPLFELKFDDMVTNIPNAFVTDNYRYTGTNHDGKGYMTASSGDSAFSLHHFAVNSTLLKDYIPANVPRQKTQYGKPNDADISGAICKFNSNIPQSTTYPYEDYGVRVITSQPTDFTTNYKYGFLYTTNQEGRPYNLRPMLLYTTYYSYSSGSGKVNYADDNHVSTHQFYTGVGSCHFTVFKTGSYMYYSDRPLWYSPILTVGFPPVFVQGWNNLSSTAKATYTLCDKHNNPVGDMSGFTGNYYHYIQWNGGYSSETDHSNRNYWQFFVHYTFGGKDFYGVCQCKYTTAYDDTDYPTYIEVLAFSNEFWGDSIISGGESGAGTWGGKTIPTVNDGTFTSTSNSVTPSNPDHSTTAIQTKVNNALSGLFSGLTGVYGIYMLDTASGTDRIFTNLNKIFGVLYDSGNDAFLNRYLQSMYNPLSAVISMHLLPYQFAASAIFGATTTKKLTISGYPVSDKIAEKYSVTAPEYNILKPIGKVAFEPITIPKFFGGFADFAPYTQCILHLPFIGAVELKTNSVAHGSITVEYLCDIMSGNVTARICCTDSENNSQYVQTVSGNCAYNIPLFSMTQDGSPVGKMLSGAAGLVSGALTGNPVNVATGAAGIVGAAVESSFSPRSTQISGNMGGNNMLMSNLDVWLEIIRPVWVENMYYQKLNGIPADMSNCIADCGQDNPAGVAYDGYLQIEKIDLDNVPCTDIEKKEIETLLKQGVFIRGAEI